MPVSRAPQQVLLIPSDEIGWTALRTMLESLPRISIIGEATSAGHVRALAATTPPDVILCALVSGSSSLLPLLADLRQVHPDSTIAVFAATADLQEIQTLAALGTRGYLVWDDLPRQKLPSVLSAILNGVMVTSETVVAVVSAALSEWWVPTEIGISLTRREQAVLAGLAAGLSRDEIATTEGVTLRTVVRTIVTLEEKLDAPSLFLLGMRAAQLEQSPRCPISAISVS